MLGESSTQCLTKTFQSFVNGITVRNRTAASEIYSNLFTYAEGAKVRVSLCILLEEN